MPRKKEGTSLFQKIYALDNIDKKNHEKWTEGRDLMNIPSPYRCVLTGRPNSGKSTVIKNFILRADPGFKMIFLLHPDPNTQEYDDLGHLTRLKEIPEPTFWSNPIIKDIKKLLIIDDVNLKSLSMKQKKNLDRLFGFVSTHCFLSICCTAQDFYQLPINIRRYSNVFCIWKSRDLSNIKTLARRVGLDVDEFTKIYKENLNDWYDFLVVDATKQSPGYVRKNGYEVLIGEY